MAEWDALYCANHPDRIALERCEVCGRPLCAYCLYYTEDGQRLCETHAEQARRAGMTVEAPAVYAEQLIGAQVGADRKRKRNESQAADGLYVGNSNDLLGLLGIVAGVVALSACCGVGYCFPVVGIVLSLAAVVNAKKAHDPRRTRRMGWIGLLISGLLVVAFVLCILSYGLSLTQISTWAVDSQGLQNILNATDTPMPTPSPLPTVTPFNSAG